MKVEKLKDNSFQAWKQKIQLLLAFKDLDELIEDDMNNGEDKQFVSWSRRDKRVKPA